MNNPSMIFSDSHSKERLKIYILLFVVSCFYVPSVFGEFISIDDIDLVEGLTRIRQVNFSRLFFGERIGALYYRPLLVSTYYFEKLFLAVDPLVMRFDNVLLQLANTLWVYLIIRKIYALKECQAGWWPLLWGLLFGLHPLATESVNWISGRTDLLAGFFVLAATWFLLNFKQNGSFFVLACALISVICALLSKEVAVAFIPGAFFIFSAQIGSRHSGLVNGTRFWRLAGGGTCLVGGLLLFVYLRSQLIVSSVNSISRTVLIISDDISYSAMLFFRLFGFYFKKIVAPWPLNFAIVEVDPLYDLLGVVVVTVLIWLFVRNRFSTDFFVIAALLLLPAYPISFGQIAWTPYAERYAYVAAAFVVFGLAAIAADYLLKINNHRVVSFFLSLFLILYASTTYARNGLWQSSITLWEDTVQKSPNSIAAHGNYGVVLYKIGDFKKAEEQFDLARTGFGYNYSPKRDITYGQLLFEAGRRSEAIAVWRETVIKSKGQSVQALSELVTQCSRSAYMNRICGGFETVSLEYSQLYELTSDPLWLVKHADFSKKLGEREQALSLYRQAAQYLPSTHPLQSMVQEILSGTKSGL